MTRPLPLSVLLLAALPLLSGCVAALIPLAAAGALGKGELDRSKSREQIVDAGAISIEAQAITPQAAPAKPAAKLEPAAASPAALTRPPASNTKSRKFGQGTEIAIGEGQLNAEARSYLSRVYRAMRPADGAPYVGFAEYALSQAAQQKQAVGEGQPLQLEGAVLVQGVDIIKPKKISCAGKPLAVMIDLDTPDMAAWSRSNILYRQDGLAENLQRLRAAEITVIWLSDLPAANAFEVSSILKDAGLAADGKNDDFLFLDRGGNDRKQARRWDAARSYCVIAIAGDKRSDFDELYDYLRDPDAAITLENMFGSGWFIAPPPLVPPPTGSKINQNSDVKDEG